MATIDPFMLPIAEKFRFFFINKSFQQPNLVAEKFRCQLQDAYALRSLWIFEVIITHTQNVTAK